MRDALCFSSRSTSAVSAHPLHTHILLYTRKYDTSRTEHALTCLKSMLVTSPRLVACSMSTTSLGSSFSTQMDRVITLLVRHRK